MSQALYRKWRPARFDQVVGQEHVTRTLKNAVAADRVGHAYLFAGPRGTGKTTIARLLAKAVNCQHKDLSERPCNQCQPCRAVADNRYLDLIEIDAASNTGVDDIRDLRDKINFAPNEGRFKVYIIDEVHMLSTAAFNALLKTLEEPPAHAKFVLATTEAHKVPATIRSRCQHFNFRLLTFDEIVGRLLWMAEQEKLTIEPEALDLIAQHGSGSLRDAESLLDQLVSEPGDTITIGRAQQILGTAPTASVSAVTLAVLAGDGPAGLQAIHDALRSGADARQFARQMVAYLRQLLLVKTAGHSLTLNLTDQQLSELNEVAKRANRQQLIEAVKHFNEASTASAAGWQAQLPLELAFIELLPHDGTPPIRSAPAVESPASKKSNTDDQEKKEPPALRAEPQAEEAGEKDGGEGVSDARITKSRIVDINAVTGVWEQLRDHVSATDRGLLKFLETCRPLAVEGLVIVLGFDYPILKDRFDKKPTVKVTFTEALTQLLGTRVSVKTTLAQHYVPPASDQGVDKEAFAALAQELGGILSDSD